jgi:hypothetical protein
MNTTAQAVRRFRVDRAKTDQASKCRLDVTAGAAEPVIQIEVTERGVQIVAPHQDDDAPAKPDAFRVSSRAAERLRRLNEFIGLALIVFCRVGRSAGGRFALILSAEIAALRNGAADTDQQRKSGRGKATHNPIAELRYSPAHKVPDTWLNCHLPTVNAVELGLQYGRGTPDSMTDILDFVQQRRNFIASW